MYTYEVNVVFLCCLKIPARYESVFKYKTLDFIVLKFATEPKFCLFRVELNNYENIFTFKNVSRHLKSSPD